MLTKQRERAYTDVKQVQKQNLSLDMFCRWRIELVYCQYQFFDSSIDIQLTFLNWVSIVVLKIASFDIVMDRKADRLISSTCGNCCVPCSEFLTSPAAYLHSSSP